MWCKSAAQLGPEQLRNLKRKMDKARDAKGKAWCISHRGLLCIRERQNISMWAAGMRRVGLPQQRPEEIRLWYTEEVRCRRCHQGVFREIKRLPELSNTFNVVRKIISSLSWRKVQEERDKTSNDSKKEPQSHTWLLSTSGLYGRTRGRLLNTVRGKHDKFNTEETNGFLEVARLYF